MMPLDMKLVRIKACYTGALILTLALTLGACDQKSKSHKSADHAGDVQISHARRAFLFGDRDANHQLVPNPHVADRIVPDQLTDPSRLLTAALGGHLPSDGNYLIQLQCGGSRGEFLDYDAQSRTLHVKLWHDAGAATAIRDAALKLQSVISHEYEQRLGVFLSTGIPDLHSLPDPNQLDPALVQEEQHYSIVASMLVLPGDVVLTLHNNPFSAIDADSGLRYAQAALGFSRYLYAGLQHQVIDATVWTKPLRAEWAWWIGFPETIVGTMWDRKIRYAGSIEDVCLVADLSRFSYGVTAYANLDGWYLVDRVSGDIIGSSTP